jgi:hypothetical protein
MPDGDGPFLRKESSDDPSGVAETELRNRISARR